MQPANAMITVVTTVGLSRTCVWELWTSPAHIEKWNAASSDWYTPHAEQDLRVGGRFLSTMSARDGSQSFDFTGVYTIVEPHTRIAYGMDDGRTVDIVFEDTPDGTKITESFDPETLNPLEMQRTGWQSILNNFKTYAERIHS